MNNITISLGSSKNSKESKKFIEEILKLSKKTKTKINFNVNKNSNMNKNEMSATFEKDGKKTLIMKKINGLTLENLKETRQFLGIKQSLLANVAEYCTCYISRLETGHYKPVKDKKNKSLKSKRIIRNGKRNAFRKNEKKAIKCVKNIKRAMRKIVNSDYYKHKKSEQKLLNQ